VLSRCRKLGHRASGPVEVSKWKEGVEKAEKVKQTQSVKSDVANIKTSFNALDMVENKHSFPT
jgi:hypothetical protein